MDREEREEPSAPGAASQPPAPPAPAPQPPAPPAPAAEGDNRSKGESAAAAERAGGAGADGARAGGGAGGREQEEQRREPRGREEPQRSYRGRGEGLGPGGYGGWGGGGGRQGAPHYHAHGGYPSGGGPGGYYASGGPSRDYNRSSAGPYAAGGGRDAYAASPPREREADGARRRSYSRSRSRSRGRSERGAGGGRRRSSSRHGGSDRSRSRSRGGRSRSRSRGRSRSRSRGRGRRGGRSRSRSRSRPQLTREEREQRAQEAAIAELTKDARTIFVSSLVARATEREVQEFFEMIGPVVHVSLIRDRTGRSKGLGYVEFASLDSVPQALLLDTANFCTRHRACMCSGLPLSIKPSEAEKNYAALAEAAGGSVLSSTAERRAYVCGLPGEMGEAELRALGAQCGAVEGAKLFRGGSGGAQHFGYIVFADATSAAAAVATLHGLAVPGGGSLAAGRLNALGHVDTPTGEVRLFGGAGGLTQQARAALMTRLSQGVSAAASKLSSAVASGGGGGGGGAAAAGPAVAVAAAVQQLQQQQQLLHMQHLQHLQQQQQQQQLQQQQLQQQQLQPQPQPQQPQPTNCLCLQNVFCAAEETEAGWEADILEGVKDEAAKHGAVVFAHLDPKHEAGLVFLMFAESSAAERALAVLNGRKFGGRAIAALPVALDAFVALFPAAAQALQEARKV